MSLLMQWFSVVFGHDKARLSPTNAVWASNKANRADTLYAAKHDAVQDSRTAGFAPYQSATRQGAGAGTFDAYEGIQSKMSLPMEVEALKHRVGELEKDFREIKEDTQEILHLMRTGKMGGVLFLSLIGLVSTVLVTIAAYREIAGTFIK
jgi:hypothetical protein